MKAGMASETINARLRAEKAARVMEDAEPFLAAMEEQAINTAVSQHWQHKEGEENTLRLLERVSVIRAFRVHLKTAIEQGRIAAQKEDAAEDAVLGVSPFA